MRSWPNGCRKRGSCSPSGVEGREDQILWTDEKIFTIEQSFNRQNDRVLAQSVSDIPPEHRYVDRTQRPASVMVWAGISSNSRTNLVFIPEGVRVTAESYRQLILETEVLDMHRHAFRNRAWTFQQDGAPAHTARVTQDWLRQHDVQFITKDEWPPYSPDLNPMDFCVWGILEARVCARPHRSLDSLKQALQQEWQQIPQDTLRDATRSVTSRLKAVIRNGGGRFE